MNGTMDDPHSLLGPYVVGAVDDVDRETFERHLRECADCRADVASMSDVVATLVDAEATPPPAALRAKVREQVASTAQLPPTVASAPRVGMSRRRRRWSLAGAVAAVAVSVAGIGAVLTNNDAPDASALEREVMMVSSAPDAHTMELGLGSSHVVMSERMRGVALMGVDAPAPAEGMEYQLWLVLDSGEMMPGPTFTPNRDGGFMAMMHTGFEGVTDFEITEEPRGGSSKPTGDTVAVVSL